MIFSALFRPKVERILVNDKLFTSVAEFRYAVYCEELGFLEKSKFPDKKESDEYDGKSIHIVVTLRKKLLGYVRVIIDDGTGLPIFENFPVLPEREEVSCEISRFMIAQEFRRKTKIRREIFNLLAKEILQVVEENKINKIYAVVEEWLLNSLRKRGYDFQIIGEGKQYMGATTLPISLKYRG